MAIPTTDEVRACLDKLDEERQESTKKKINSRLVPPREMPPGATFNARGQAIPVRNKRGVVVHMFFWEEINEKGAAGAKPAVPFWLTEVQCPFCGMVHPFGEHPFNPRCDRPLPKAPEETQ